MVVTILYLVCYYTLYTPYLQIKNMTYITDILYKKIRKSHDTNMMVIAIILGCMAGLFGVIFRFSLDTISHMTFGGDSLNFLANISQFDWWYILAIPTLGGVIVGAIKYTFAPQILQGMGDIIAVCTRKRHSIHPRNIFWSFMMNITTLGTGGSSGSLGPIVHLVGGATSAMLDRLHIPRDQGRTILGCVVAAAVGASLNAPMAAMFFASELIVGSYAISYILPIVIASVTGTLVTNLIYGEYSGFSLSDLAGVSPFELPLFIILGILSATMAKGFIYGLDKAESIRTRYGIPLYVSPALGGLGVGVIALVFPQVLGTGYFATDLALTGSLSIIVLGGLVIAKYLASMCTLGFGGGGGMFFPSMFIGALLGGFYGSIILWIAGQLGYDMGHAYTVYSVAGMGAMSASVLGAPVSAIFLIFELSHNYSLSLSVMVSTLVAARMMQRMGIKSVFLHQLMQKGFDLSGSRDDIYARDITARDLMWQDYCKVHKTDSIAHVREVLITSLLGRVYVIDDDGVLLGDISLHSMGKNAFDMECDDRLTIQDIWDTQTPYVYVDTTLDKMIHKYQLHKDTVFVVTDSHKRIQGILHENDVLIAYKDIVHSSREQERL